MAFVLLLVLSTVCAGLSYRRVSTLPLGVPADYGRISFFDSDRDSHVELHFKSSRSMFWKGIYFFGTRLWDRHILVDSVNPPPGSMAWYPWTVGSYDRDSLTDMVVEMGCSLAVFESPTDTSLPKLAIWKWRYEHGGGTVCPTIVADLDSDGNQDICFSEWNILYVFENDGDDAYRCAFRESVYVTGSPYWKTDGDFDLDGRQEIVMGYERGAAPYVIVYECIGNDQYVKTWMDSTPYPNSHSDCFRCDDADNDGRPEFAVGWCVYEGMGCTWGFRIYETAGNNRYRQVFWDTVRGVPSAFGPVHGTSCDVDGDGTAEIIWAAPNNWFIYKAVGDDQYQRTYTAYARVAGSGLSSTSMSAYDLNKNGYAEIIESGEFPGVIETETRIWEIEGVRLHRPNGGEVLQPGSQFAITWEKFTPPGADSFSLFVSFNNGVDYQTIATIRQSDDTLFTWSVPDTLADSCKIMIWAYGPPRPGENTPRGTAWDFSDSSFAIRQTRIAEGTGNRPQVTGLKILQNPTTVKQGIKIRWTWDEGRNGTGKADRPSPSARLQIYDVSGKVIQSVPITNNQLPITVRCNAGGPQGAALPAGVYFVRLESAGITLTKKVVVLE